MARGDYLGEFEELTLLAVTRCGQDAYGMEVRREIATRTGRDVSIGGVYATLERLTGKGLLRAVTRQRRDDEDGRPRKFFQITASGIDALETADDLRRKLRGGVRVKGTLR